MKPETKKTDLRRSDRLRQQTAANLIKFLDDDSTLEFAMAASHIPLRDPTNIEEAHTQSNWPEWQKSIWCELNQHEQVGTWELVDPPSGVNIVGSQIVLHYKLDKHGTIQEYKARVIAQGFSQIEGINYNETFSPMAKLTAIWIIIALAVRSDWEIDVVGAYLNAKLKDDIFICQLKGFEVPGKECSVLHLKRAIYRLKQSGHEWYDDLKDTLISMGFACHVENAVVHHYDQDTVIILAVDVDDITIAGDSKRCEEIQRPVRHVVQDQRYGWTKLAAWPGSHWGLRPMHNHLWPEHVHPEGN